MENNKNEIIKVLALTGIIAVVFFAMFFYEQSTGKITDFSQFISDLFL